MDALTGLWNLILGLAIGTLFGTLASTQIKAALARLFGRSK